MKFFNTGLYHRFRYYNVLVFIMYFGMAAYGQIRSGIQLNLDGGVSIPVSEFKNQDVFAGNGKHFSGGLDYYFFKGLGIGVEGGYFDNRSDKLFDEFIYRKYYQIAESSKQSFWQTKYIFAGPTIKWSLGWFEMDFTGKIGVTQIAGPKLYYDKLYFGEAYDVYRFTKEGQDWSVAWSAGARAIFKVNSWMGIQAKVDYWDTQIFDRALYSYTYKDVIDLDSNGQLDDEEFFTSTTVSRRGATDVRTLNLNLGLIFQFGNTTKRPNEVIDQAMVSEMKVEKESDQANIDEGQNKIGDDAVITQEKNVDPSLEMAIRDSSILSEMPTSVIHGDEDIDKKEGRDTDSMGLASQEDQALLEELEKQRLDSLYDAGEYFFSTQQYRQAADHFNQALDHPDYPRSRYMYALSLSFSGDCEQAKREFKQFKKEYTGSDLRSLEVLFVSQFENCTSISKNNQGSEGIQQKDVIVINKDEKRKTDHLTITETNKAGIKSTVDIDSSAIHPVLKKEYQVQFIAIGHTDAIFKEMAKLGKINIEYIKDKKLYRYSLTGFERLEDALPLLKRVRGLGFSDAFIALYQDGVRKETMFHDEISKD